MSPLSFSLFSNSLTEKLEQRLLSLLCGSIIISLPDGVIPREKSQFTILEKRLLTHVFIFFIALLCCLVILGFLLLVLTLSTMGTIC